MIELLLAILIIGVVAWVISAMPIAEPFKIAAYGVLLIIFLLFIAKTFGYGPGVNL